MCPLLGAWLSTQACALTEKRTGDPLICRPALNPLSHTSQGLFNSFTYQGRSYFIFNFIFIVDNITDVLVPPPPFATPSSPCTPFPRAITTLLSVSVGHAYMFFGQSRHLLWSSPPTPLSSDRCPSVSILSVSLFCSLDSTYEWNHMVFVFLRQAYFP